MNLNTRLGTKEQGFLNNPQRETTTLFILLKKKKKQVNPNSGRELSDKKFDFSYENFEGHAMEGKYDIS